MHSFQHANHAVTRKDHSSQYTSYDTKPEVHLIYHSMDNTLSHGMSIRIRISLSRLPHMYRAHQYSTSPFTQRPRRRRSRGDGSIVPFHDLVKSLFGTIVPFHDLVKSLFGTIVPFHDLAKSLFGDRGCVIFLPPWHETSDSFIAKLNSHHGSLEASEAVAPKLISRNAPCYKKAQSAKSLSLCLME
jgi:hypothetical protein